MAWLPGLLLGGEEQEELHKGKLVEGPGFLCCSLPSKQDQGATQAPGSPAKHHIFSSASSVRRKCQVPAIGVLVASRHFLFHPPCLAVQSMRKAPSNNSPFPALKQTLRVSPSSHTPTPGLPLSLPCAALPTLPAPSLQQVFPNSAPSLVS